MNKTKKMMTGVLATLVGTSLTGCGSLVSGEIPDPPTGTDCTNWEWDDGQWECEDYDSDYFGYYYHNGVFYRTAKSKSKLASKIISSSVKSNSSTKSTTLGKTSSGFGSSSKSGGYTGG